MAETYAGRLGATYLGESGTEFCVWAPLIPLVEVHELSPRDRVVPLSADHGYHHGVSKAVRPGDRYVYRLDGGRERPDPASGFQPEGVHGPSQIIEPRFSWEDIGWGGVLLSDFILYELHVGAFTAEGTFPAIVPYLGYLKDLGITAIEIMPVAQFPGSRNWGYDGTYLYAVQNSYGGPESLERLVNACHIQGIAVVLDVVYNHLGPEGNYLSDFGPYFTERYKTPWGPAVNFDGPYSDGVRRFFIENALRWVTDYHIDALRIDAVHGIFDFSARHFLEELANAVHEQAEKLNRRIYVIAESDLNDSRLIRSRERGGYGLDAQWNDDFHHALHALLTHERTGYYEDFGEFPHMVKAFREGFVYSGDYSSYRKRRHGNNSADIPARELVVFSQNHDQVGNRALSERLTELTTSEGLKLAAAAVLLSPFIPLLFMGEEYGETAPFPYFVSHSDPDLVEAVRQGRREEFKAFGWPDSPVDPQDEVTFLKAKLDHARRDTDRHHVIHEFYKALIALRKEIEAAPHDGKPREILSWPAQEVILVRRWTLYGEVVILLNFSGREVSITVPLTEGRWLKRLDSAELRWHGPGNVLPDDFDSEGEMSFSMSSHAAALFTRCEETGIHGPIRMHSRPFLSAAAGESLA